MVKRFTAEEDQRLRQMVYSGEKIIVIAVELSRAKSSILDRMIRLGLEHPRSKKIKGRHLIKLYVSETQYARLRREARIRNHTLSSLIRTTLQHHFS